MKRTLRDLEEGEYVPGQLTLDDPALTPTAQLAVNGGSQHPTKRAAGGHGPTLADEVEHLLPTPTATPYGSNRSSSPGAAVRPSLDTLAPAMLCGTPMTEPRLLPTATATDAKGSRGYRRDGTRYGPTSGETLTDAIEGRLLPTPRATDGTKGGPNQRGSGGDLMLPSAVHRLTDGDPTDPPSPDGRLF